MYGLVVLDGHEVLSDLKNRSCCFNNMKRSSWSSLLT